MKLNASLSLGGVTENQQTMGSNCTRTIDITHRVYINSTKETSGVRDKEIERQTEMEMIFLIN